MPMVNQVEDTHDGDKSRLQRNRSPFEAVIAAAVPSFMMIERDALGHLENRELASGENDSADVGMSLDLDVLLGREFAWLEQDSIRDADLAHIVQWSGQADQLHVLLGKTDGSSE